MSVYNSITHRISSICANPFSLTKSEGPEGLGPRLAGLPLNFVAFGLETSDTRKPAKRLSPRNRETNKIIYFLLLSFLAWPYNLYVINRARPVCMGESWLRWLVQTSLRSVCTERPQSGQTDLPLG